MLKIKFSYFVSWALCVLSLATVGAAQKSPELKPEEIVAKHIASIGTPEMLAVAAIRVIEGKSQAREVQTSFNTVQGKSLLASAADKTLLKLSFPAISTGDYTGESIGFDGKKLIIPNITAQGRSALGNFVFSYKEIMKQGLFGGSLTSSWAMLDTKNKIAKFTYEGTKKIGNTETHILRCVPRGGSALTIKLFFDTETFRHLRTEYYEAFSPPVTVADEGRATENRFNLVEDFSDFKRVSELTLPTTYKITYTAETRRASKQFEWLMKFSRFAYTKQLQDDLFQ